MPVLLFKQPKRYTLALLTYGCLSFSRRRESVFVLQNQNRSPTESGMTNEILPSGMRVFYRLRQVSWGTFVSGDNPEIRMSSYTEQSRSFVRTEVEHLNKAYREITLRSNRRVKIVSLSPLATVSSSTSEVENCTG